MLNLPSGVIGIPPVDRFVRYVTFYHIKKFISLPLRHSEEWTELSLLGHFVYLSAANKTDF